jgi:HEXXH motif-containing protein
MNWLFGRVLYPAPEFRTELSSRGFVFQDKFHRRVLRSVLRDAAQLLAKVPSLENAVERAVDEVVVLRASPAFDISHSEPRWPKTVFISVPGRASSVSALRAIENVIHEAMHLQLTMLEITEPLVANATTQMRSPWRKELRLIQGVLHGVYVFRCIAAFFSTAALLDEMDAMGAWHLMRRRKEIASDLGSVDYKTLAAGLTPRGKEVLNFLKE